MADSTTYIFGDTHANMHIIDMKKLFKMPYKKGDCAIVCGDFGVLWEDIKDEKEQKLESYLNKLPCDVLFLDGNHENFNRLNNLPEVERYGDMVGRYSHNVFHLKRGRIYHINGAHYFIMGGAMSIDKEFLIENKSWWSAENITQDELDFALKNIAQSGKTIDFVLTHTIPTRAVKKLGEYMELFDDVIDENSQKLERIFNALESSAPNLKAWIFGHWHEDGGFALDFNNRALHFFCLYNENAITINSDKSFNLIGLEW